LIPVLKPASFNCRHSSRTLAGPDGRRPSFAVKITFVWIRIYFPRLRARTLVFAFAYLSLLFAVKKNISPCGCQRAGRV